MSSVARPDDRTWPVHAVLFASVSVMTGVLWDISWHQSIGRDTFWTPAHMAIYLGGVVAGLSCGWLALKITFDGTPAEKAATVRFWRIFHAPLGAWVAIWGAFAMITSAPFDDWWHNAYGLDVEILSPPHMVLAMGIIAIQVGALLMLAARQNRAEGTALDRWLYAVAGGILLVMIATLLTEETIPNAWHSALPYKIMAGALPLVFVGMSRSSRLRWPATTLAVVYWLCVSVIGWVLQLFPAQPLLAPIFNPIEHFVAPFPPLMLVPAGIGVDWVLRHWRWDDWSLTPVLAATFVVLLVGALWPWGEFLLSPAARNWFFMADQWSYQARPGAARHEFWAVEADPLFTAASAAWILGLGMVSTRLGLWWGHWMKKVKR